MVHVITMILVIAIASLRVYKHSNGLMLILTTYLIPFAIIGLLVEFKVYRLYIYFKSMNYTWGKALAYF